MSEEEKEKADANADADAAPTSTSTSTPTPTDADEGSFPTVGGMLVLLDLESRPRSKAGWAVRVAVTVAGAFYLWHNVNALAGPMLSAKPPPVIPSEELPGDRFRLSEAERREIFKEFATAELAERNRAITQNTWQGHAWSREDDRGYIERTTARASAARHHVSLSQVYLVLDEGVREKWPGPDGKPLPGNTPAFNPRTTW